MLPYNSNNVMSTLLFFDYYIFSPAFIVLYTFFYVIRVIFSFYCNHFYHLVFYLAPELHLICERIPSQITGTTNIQSYKKMCIGKRILLLDARTKYPAACIGKLILILECMSLCVRECVCSFNYILGCHCPPVSAVNVRHLRASNGYEYDSFN